MDTVCAQIFLWLKCITQGMWTRRYYVILFYVNIEWLVCMPLGEFDALCRYIYQITLLKGCLAV